MNIKDQEVKNAKEKLRYRESNPGLRGTDPSAAS